jgi:CDP-diacylglycerol---glycerol-3-phosphate 3-phosphatidyltransferase
MTTMLNRYARAFATKLLSPVAAVLLRLGISPDVVTVIGTLGVCFGALAFYPRGELLVGTLVISFFVFADTLDGIMARSIGRSGNWGAYLDSTLDRVADAAIFGGLVLYFAGSGRQGSDLAPVMAGLALACLILGSVVSYAKARAEGLGMTAERLLVVLIATGFTGLLDLPWIYLGVVLALLALASLITVVQRMLEVRRQALGAA